MAAISFIVLHGAPGLEITFLDYLARVGLYLLAFGGVAALVYWGTSAVNAIQSAFIADREGEVNER